MLFQNQSDLLYIQGNRIKEICEAALEYISSNPKKLRIEYDMPTTCSDRSAIESQALEEFFSAHKKKNRKESTKDIYDFYTGYFQFLDDGEILHASSDTSSLNIVVRYDDKRDRQVVDIVLKKIDVKQLLQKIMESVISEYNSVYNTSSVHFTFTSAYAYITT